MTKQQILESNNTKTRKIQLLLELGMNRTEVARAMGVGYGFVQNVFAKKYPHLIRRRVRRLIYRATNFNQKFGIEIEFFGVNKIQLNREINNLGVACVIEGYNHRTRSHWKIITDSSISGSRGDSCELVSPPIKGLQGIEELKKVCQALKSNRALINKTCGLHIHFDATDFNLQTWKNVYKNYIQFEDVIDSMMPRSRRGNSNYYCKSLLNKFSSKEEAFRKIDAARSVEQISKIVTGRKRYCKINAESFFRHGTIEFRQHSGTREFVKMENWLYLLHRLVDYSKQGFVAQGNEFEAMKEFMTDDCHDFYFNRIQDLAA